VNDAIAIARQRLTHLNTITRGISADDFYLTVPQAIVNFLADRYGTARPS
jgi:hypothetical protein